MFFVIFIELILIFFIYIIDLCYIPFFCLCFWISFLFNNKFHLAGRRVTVGVFTSPHLKFSTLLRSSTSNNNFRRCCDYLTSQSWHQHQIQTLMFQTGLTVGNYWEGSLSWPHPNTIKGTVLDLWQEAVWNPPPECGWWFWMITFPCVQGSSYWPVDGQTKVVLGSYRDLSLSTPNHYITCSKVI